MFYPRYYIVIIVIVAAFAVVNVVAAVVVDVHTTHTINGTVCESCHDSIDVLTGINEGALVKTKKQEQFNNNNNKQ